MKGQEAGRSHDMQRFLGSNPAHKESCAKAVGRVKYDTVLKADDYHAGYENMIRI